MSVPPGTEMFQFPGFASAPYGFRCGYLIEVGCPIRTPRDQRLLAAPPSFSQRATSFFASWRQGIHQMPFSYSKPRHAPRKAVAKPRTGPIQPEVSRQTPGVRHDPEQPTSGRIGSNHTHTSHLRTHTDRPCRGPSRNRGQPPSETSRPRPETQQNLIHNHQRTPRKP